MASGDCNEEVQMQHATGPCNVQQVFHVHCSLSISLLSKLVFPKCFSVKAEFSSSCTLLQNIKTKFKMKSQFPQLETQGCFTRISMCHHETQRSNMGQKQPRTCDILTSSMALSRREGRSDSLNGGKRWMHNVKLLKFFVHRRILRPL